MILRKFGRLGIRKLSIQKAIHFLLTLLIEVMLINEDRKDVDMELGLLQQLNKMPRLKLSMLKKLPILKLDKFT